mmetsp:Transcript_1192/g.5299  ORF Transcript_1192/g.5299 Transcript_1192/m.5299 type:complete len:326 (-) Transcript_1192:602-1579(-)
MIRSEGRDLLLYIVVLSENREDVGVLKASEARDTTREPGTLQCEGVQPGVTLNQGRKISLCGGRRGEIRGVGSRREASEGLQVDPSVLRQSELVVVRPEWCRSEVRRKGTRRGCRSSLHRALTEGHLTETRENTVRASRHDTLASRSQRADAAVIIRDSGELASKGEHETSGTPEVAKLAEIRATPSLRSRRCDRLQRDFVPFCLLPDVPAVFVALLQRLGPVSQLLAQQTGLARLVVAIKRGHRVEGAARLTLSARLAAVGQRQHAVVFRAGQGHAAVRRGLLTGVQAVVHLAATLVLDRLLSQQNRVLSSPQRVLGGRSVRGI